MAVNECGCCTDAARFPGSGEPPCPSCGHTVAQCNEDDMNDEKYIQQPTPEQQAAMDTFVRTLPRLPNPFDGRDPHSGFDHEAAERRAMVLAIKLHNDEVMHFRACPDCAEPQPLCPRGQELSQAAWMAHETVMEFILGEPTKEDIDRATQALRDAFTKANTP